MSIATKVKVINEMLNDKFIKTLELMIPQDVYELAAENEEFKLEMLTLDQCFHELLWNHGTYDVLTVSHFNQSQTDKNKKLELLSAKVSDEFMERFKKKLVKSSNSNVIRWQLVYRNDDSKVILMDRTIAIIERPVKS